MACNVGGQAKETKYGFQSQVVRTESKSGNSVQSQNGTTWTKYNVQPKSARYHRLGLSHLLSSR